MAANTTLRAEDDSGGIKLLNETYRLIWTPEVVFRVTTIVVVMVLTLVGNTTLVVIIMCHKKLRRRRVNVFLVNLAVGDLMVCFVTMTTEILFVAFGEWVLGALACKLIVYGQIVTLASATFLLTGMSIDRYQVIVQPLRSLTGQPKIWKKVLAAWIAALIFAIPQLLIFVQTDEGIRPDGTIKHMCRSLGYTKQWQRKLYFTFLATYILVIPTIIMSFCYINIIRVVWMRTDSYDGKKKPKFRFVTSLRRTHGSINSRGGKDQNNKSTYSHSNQFKNSLRIPKKLVSNSKRNVIKMTLSVIIGFVLCWTPYYIAGLIRIFSNYTIKIPTFLSVAEIIALVHSALNPILYGIFSTKAAKKVLSQICCTKKNRPRYDTSIASEDETGTCDESTWTEGRHERINMNNLNGNALNSPYGSYVRRNVIPIRMARIVAYVIGRDRQNQSGPTRDTAIPLLVYRRMRGRHTCGGNPNVVTSTATQDSVCPSGYKSTDLSSESEESRSPHRVLPVTSTGRASQYLAVATEERAAQQVDSTDKSSGTDADSSDGAEPEQIDKCAFSDAIAEEINTAEHFADEVIEIHQHGRTCPDLAITSYSKPTVD